MTISRAALPRFLAYDLASGRVVMTGTDARQILNHIRDQLWPSVDAGSVEILDCGPAGVDEEVVSMSVDDARQRFPAVYRGADGGSLAPIALSVRS